MTAPRCLWVWIFLSWWLLSGTPGAAWAKDRTARTQTAQPEQKAENKTEIKAEKKPDKKIEPQSKKKVEKKAEKKAIKNAAKPPLAATAAPKPQVAEDPRTYLSRAREQENGGDISGCLLSLAKFINVYPQNPERAAALQKMAQLAQTQGQQNKALEIYALTASLYPGSQAAAEARWQMHNLDFFQNLRERDPLASFKDYLLRVKSLAPGVTAEKFREPLRQGWLAVEGVLRRTSPCPVHLLEEALALWELHPEGTQIPEAALVIGELLQENGLYTEARSCLQRAREQGSPEIRARALVGLLEGAWASRDLPEFAGAWMHWRQNRGEIAPALKSRLDKLPLPEALFAEATEPGQEKKAEEDAVAALLDWWSGKSPDPSRQADLLRCLEHFLRRPLPPAVKERLLLQLAQLQWSQGHFPQAARIYQQLLAANAKGENSAFYQDRLALSQLQGRRPEAALEIYRGLSQEGDNFWQLVSRTRLADVELGRLQMEPLQ
jgi:tetratricopeptide (TPR) repeat protein